MKDQKEPSWWSTLFMSVSLGLLALTWGQEPSSSQREDEAYSRSDFEKVRFTDPSLSNSGEKKPSSETFSRKEKSSPKLTTSSKSPEPHDSVFLKIEEIQSWSDLKKVNLPVVTKDLLLQMEKDQFGKTKPFLSLRELNGVKAILQKGILSFERKTFRSPEFILSSGYDMVTYEILNSNGHKSKIIAYKQKTEESQISIGETDDLRPLFTLFVAGAQNGDIQSESYFYENGRLKTQKSAESAQAKVDIDMWIKLSTPLYASGW